jgi:hypothetical protein
MAPRRPSESPGADAEQRAREIAALFGVPDFVYRPLLERKGSTHREISDGMVICGEDGLIMLVKAREAPTRDTPQRAERWIRKNAQAARRQAEGTRRRLAQSRSVTFTSLRGYRRTLSAIEGWSAVVVIDHPSAPPQIQLPQSADTLWITIGDWHELHNHLLSTAAVIAYVKRALESGLHPPLGSEADRYLALARADAAAHGGPSSVPMVPIGVLEPHDALYAAVIDDLIEMVWPQDGPIPWREPDEYRAIVERLDRIPPAMRARLGRKIVTTLEEAIATEDRRSFLLYDTSQEARILFVCDVLGDREPEDRLMGEITLLASVRQHQALESGADPTASRSRSGSSTPVSEDGNTPSHSSARRRPSCPTNRGHRSNATTGSCADAPSNGSSHKRAAAARPPGDLALARAAACAPHRAPYRRPRARRRARHHRAGW